MIWNWIQAWILIPIAVRVLRMGAIPKHVAIVMDGNRRWATGHALEKKEGHFFGYKKLEQVIANLYHHLIKKSLDWFELLGVEQVTVFAFSIENYKRPKHEVDYLMKLAQEKFTEMLQKRYTTYFIPTKI